MARAADVKKAYTVAIIFFAVGGLWAMFGRGDDGLVPTIALGLMAGGGIGIIGAAFLSIRTKRREAKSA